MNEIDLFEIEPEDLPNWLSQPIAVFDLETTGLDLKTARIVTACAALIDSNGLVIGDDVEWLANPGVPIPIEASNVHGITNEIAKAKGRPLDLVVAEIVETLSGFFEKGIPVVAYNAPYDFTILRQHAEDFGIAWPENPAPVIDPLVIDKTLAKYRKGKRKLENVAEVYGVTLTDAHNAKADAVAAGRIAQALVRAFPNELGMSLPELHQAQIAWSAAIDEDFAKYMRSIGRSDFKAVLGWPEKPR